MDQTSTSLDLPEERPSMMRRFWSGFGSGVVSGALMMGIFTGLTLLVSASGLGTAWFGMAEFEGLAKFASHAIGPLLTGITSAGLFTGVMTAKRASEESPKLQPANEVAANTALIPMVGMAPSLEVANDTLADDLDMTTENAAKRSKSWAATVARRPNVGVQQIIADHKMSAKDRATAILAEREAANAEQNTAMGA